MARISKEDQEKIRKNILEVSQKMFNEFGFDDTSTKKIAKEVGIAEGTLFNYFPSKNDLYLEVIYEEYKDRSFQLQLGLLETNVAETVYQHLVSNLNFIFHLPKRAIIEIFIVSVKIGKKNPEKLKKYAELDFKYLKELEIYLDKLIENEILKEVNTKDLSELVYSAFVMELMMYCYDKSMKKEQLKQQIKNKIKLLVSGYVKGGEL